MFPRLFTFKIPEFLRGFLPETLSLNSYGLCIGLGIISAYYIILYKNKKLGINKDQLSELFVWAFGAAFVGGKLLFYLEDPSKYINKPSLMLQDLGNGFVFYGSLLLVVPTLYILLRRKKIPFWPFMDGVAFAGPILHSFGRLGCFLAGCCHGKVCDNSLGVFFSHPQSAADIKNLPLYPTQLFDIAINLFTLLVVYVISKKQKFSGQLFLIYIMLYAFGRAINEHFRGDEERGFVFGGMLTYSQLIAILLLVFSSVLWFILQRKEKIG